MTDHIPIRSRLTAFTEREAPAKKTAEEAGGGEDAPLSDQSLFWLPQAVSEPWVPRKYLPNRAQRRHPFKPPQC